METCIESIQFLAGTIFSKKCGLSDERVQSRTESECVQQERSNKSVQQQRQTRAVQQVRSEAACLKTVPLAECAAVRRRNWRTLVRLVEPLSVHAAQLHQPLRVVAAGQEQASLVEAAEVHVRLAQL